VTTVDHVPTTTRVPTLRRVDARHVTAAACALPIVVLGVLAWKQRWVADDAFIDFRVISNLHHGLGPVYNAGERVEVFTSPLWVAILWATSAVIRIVPLEWLAVVLGVAATLAGLSAAARGSLLLWRATGRTGLALPVGLLVLVALRPMWDFSTSGLETGLTFLWLGGSFLGVVRATTKPGRWPRLSAVVIGLGPLVRPDLAIFSAGFLVALLATAPRDRRAWGLRLVAWAAALPFAYQIFRMGYFAALEPNTALAKEAGSSDWSRGWSYLKDFVDPYLLAIPIVLIGAFVVLELRGGALPRRRLLLVGLAPVVAGALHALYVVRVGGDFMHARMLLPSLFGFLLPVSVVRPSPRGRHMLLGLGVAAWALVCAVALRAPYANHWSTGPIGDEHAFYVIFSGTQHPVTLHDYSHAAWAQDGQLLRQASQHSRALVLRIPVFGTHVQPNGSPDLHSPQPVVASAGAIGMMGYAAGPNVQLVDQLGLADPLASRTRVGPVVAPLSFLYAVQPGRDRYVRVPARRRAGHEKYLPTEWVAARFGPRGEVSFPGISLSPTELAAARRALQCGPIRRLLTAVTAPMTPDRFLSNIGASFSLTSLRFPADPLAAAREVCSPRAG